MNDLTTMNQNGLTMSTREIAKRTGKQHNHVLRDADKMLEELGEGAASKFGSTYKDGSGKTNRCFRLPKRECLILVSGYSLELRARIIDRWIELEDAARGPQFALPDDPTLRGIALLAIEQDRVNKRLTAIEARLRKPTTHMTIVAFWAAHGVDLSSEEANRLGRRAAMQCNLRSEAINPVPDDRWGTVNAYPLHILEELFADARQLPGAA